MKEDLSGLHIGHLTSPYTHAADNMMLEEKFLERNEAVFFVHRDEPCVSVGFNQELEAEVNVGYAQSLGIDIVRRKTGGGAVYRDKGCIACSFVIPLEALGSIPDILLSSLHGLGLSVRFSGNNDIFIGDGKVSGMAWREDASMAVIHASILFSVDIDRMTALLDTGKRKYRGTAIRSVRSRVCNIAEYLPRMSAEEFAERLEAALVSCLNQHGACVFETAYNLL